MRCCSVSNGFVCVLCNMIMGLDKLRNVIFRQVCSFAWGSHKLYRETEILNTVTSIVRWRAMPWDISFWYAFTGGRASHHQKEKCLSALRVAVSCLCVLARKCFATGTWNALWVAVGCIWRQAFISRKKGIVVPYLCILALKCFVRWQKT